MKTNQRYRKRNCEECNRTTKTSWRYKGIFYCYICYKRRIKCLFHI